MEIMTWVFYAFFGILAFGIGVYFIFSPSALVIGLFNPRAVLDDKKPQTQIRALKNYGITSTIFCSMAFSVFSPVQATESSYAAAYSTPSVAMMSTYISSVQPKSAVSQDAARIRTGMTFEQVISILGEPDTVLNDEIRESIGELATGDDLHTFYWRNGKPDCFPVAVNFSYTTKRVTGIDEGRVCVDGLGQTSLGVPLGESCTDNQLCNF